MNPSIHSESERSLVRASHLLRHQLSDYERCKAHRLCGVRGQRGWWNHLSLHPLVAEPLIVSFDREYHLCHEVGEDAYLVTGRSFELEIARLLLGRA